MGHGKTGSSTNKISTTFNKYYGADHKRNTGIRTNKFVKFVSEIV